MGYQAEIKELTSFVLMIVIVLYTVTVVANLVKAQSSYLTGSSYKYGDDKYGDSSLSVTFDGGKGEATWVGLAKTVIAVIVGTGYFLIAVNAMWTLFKGQSEHMIGRPFQMSEALVKLGGVLIGGVLTVFAAQIAQSLVDGIAGMF